LQSWTLDCQPSTISVITSSGLGSSLYRLGGDPTENTISQQYFHCWALSQKCVYQAFA
jgi:hypothetical protein